MPHASDALAVDLLEYIDCSPTPYHAVSETARRLVAAGYSQLDEADAWQLSPGDRRYVVRNEGSLVAFEVGAESPAAAGFRIIGAHTDSPNLRLKPNADLDQCGYRQLAVEPYGGVLLHTWFDRDLSLAGRVTIRESGSVRTVLVDFERPLLRIPNLAIHLQPELRTDGLKLNAQKHAVPILGLEGAPPLAEWLASELGSREIASIDANAVLGFDLMTYDLQASAVIGLGGEFICAPRLDNLASCHAALAALTSAPQALPGFTRAVVCNDHEEVGSRSAGGAAGPFLGDVLERVVSGYAGAASQDTARAYARSTLISADMAHAVHPNFADLHEPLHRPVVGQGPVIKLNAGQAYASDAPTAGGFAALCEDEGITPQVFVVRSDLGCGSTIGPITATRLGIRTVDVGNPMLSMHSCREMAGAADVAPMVAVMRRFFSAA